FGDGGLAAPAGVGAAAVAVEPDDGVVVAGAVPNGRGRVQSFGQDPIQLDSTDFAAVRLLPDGTPDPAFGNGGMVAVPFTRGWTCPAGRTERRRRTPSGRAGRSSRSATRSSRSPGSRGASGPPPATSMATGSRTRCSSPGRGRRR